MHLWKEGKSKHRALFKALIEDCWNDPPLDVIRKHFPSASLTQLTTEMQVHAGRLRKR